MAVESEERRPSELTEPEPSPPKTKKERQPVRLRKELPRNWNIDTMKAEIRAWAGRRLDGHRVLVSLSVDLQRTFLVRFRCISCHKCKWHGTARVERTKNKPDGLDNLVIRATEESQHGDFSNKLRPNSLTAEERQVVKEILLQRVQTRLQKVMQARAGGCQKLCFTRSSSPMLPPTACPPPRPSSFVTIFSPTHLMRPPCLITQQDLLRRLPDTKAREKQVQNCIRNLRRRNDEARSAKYTYARKYTT